jgi:hypothetical protein
MIAGRYLVVFAVVLGGCGGASVQQRGGEAVESAPPVPDSEASGYTVEFGDRVIDLEPYVQGFPYFGFEPDIEHGRMLYFHTTPDGTWLLQTPLGVEGEVDVSAGTRVNDIDWSTRSWWGALYHEASNRSFVWADDANEERMNIFALDWATGALDRVTDNDYTYGFDVDDDERRLVYIARNGTEEPFNSCLHVRDLTTGDDRRVVCDEGSESVRFTWTGVEFVDADTVVVRVQENLDRNQPNLARVELDAGIAQIELLLPPSTPR